MSEDRFEAYLRQTPLSGPSPGVKARLLERASRRMRGWRGVRTLRLVFAAAAALLIAVNLVFGQVHQARLATIAGPAAVHSLETGGLVSADAFAERSRLLTSLLEAGGALPGGDEDDTGILPDLQTNRQNHRASLA